jgi:phosphate transport system permease protein
MSTLSAAAILLLLTAAGYWAGRGRALALAARAPVRLHSRPTYHGAWVALASALPGLALLALSPWLALAVSALLGVIAWSRVSARLRARPLVEAAVRLLFAASSLIAILATIGIVLSLVFEAARFFERVPATEFLFGTQWSPQTAIRADQVGSSGAFGAVPVFAGTLLITAIAMTVAVPIGLLSAVYMSEYASPRARTLLKPMLEILAGIPTVVYGFFAALSVGPFIRSIGVRVGLDVASESALSAGLVMGVMIIPFVS